MTSFEDDSPGSAMHTPSHTQPPELSKRSATGLMTGMWPLAVPIIFAQLGETIMGVTDTMLLARVGTTELAAIGMADAVYDLYRIAMIGLIDAIQIVTARRVGQRNDRGVGAAFNQGFALVILLSLVLTFVLKTTSPYATEAVLKSDDLTVAVDSFLQLIAFGLIFHSANMALSALLVSLGRTRALIGATVVMAVTNFVVGYCLIFGAFGLPEMGIRGAAIGSIAAEFAAFLFLLGHTLRFVDVRRYALFQWPQFDRRMIRLLSIISWPVALQAGLECLRWFTFFIIVEQVSEELLALSNIVYCGYALLLIPSEAFSEVANSRVSTLIGAGDGDRIGSLARRLIALSMAATLPFILLMLLIPGPILSVFMTDATMVEESVGGLRMVAVAMLIVIPGETWLASVVGTGDTLASFVIEFIMTVAMLSCAYVAAFMMEWPLEYIWISVPIGWLTAFACSFVYVKSGAWKRLEI